MSEISNLMGQFADKIMEQQTDIEMIHQHATETKTNVTQVRFSLCGTECFAVVVVGLTTSRPPCFVPRRAIAFWSKRKTLDADMAS